MRSRNIIKQIKGYTAANHREDRTLPTVFNMMTFHG